MDTIGVELSRENATSSDFNRFPSGKGNIVDIKKKIYVKNLFIFKKKYYKRPKNTRLCIHDRNKRLGIAKCLRQNVNTFLNDFRAIVTNLRKNPIVFP